MHMLNSNINCFVHSYHIGFLLSDNISRVNVQTSIGIISSKKSFGIE